MNFTIPCTPDVVSWLQERRVYLSAVGPDYRPRSTTLVVSDDDVIESYSGLFAGQSLCTVGAFSYSQSVLPPGTRVGRYCSIEVGLTVQKSVPLQTSATTSNILFERGGPVFRSFAEDHGAIPAPGKVAGRWLKPPTLGHDVWIGRDVHLARNITLGTGCIVQDGAVVRDDVPAYAMVSGNPARVIGFRFDLNTVAKLLRSRWWDFPPEMLLNADLSSPQSLLAGLGEAQPGHDPVGSFRGAELRRFLQPR